jgi:hypothetical protein
MIFPIEEHFLASVFLTTRLQVLAEGEVVGLMGSSSFGPEKALVLLMMDAMHVIC